MGIRVAVVVAWQLAAPLPMVETSIVTTSHSGEGDGFSWARLDAPAARAARHLEIEARGAGAVWLNGTPVAPNEVGGFDVDWVARKRNVVVRRPAGPVKLRVTPRVYIAKVEPAAAGKVKVWVRNTLENTSNVFLSIREIGSAEGGEAPGEISRTVPPGVTQIMELAEPDRGRSMPVFVVLDKEEEAMEGGYRHRVRLPDSVMRR